MCVAIPDREIEREREREREIERDPERGRGKKCKVPGLQSNTNLSSPDVTIASLVIFSNTI